MHNAVRGPADSSDADPRVDPDRVAQPDAHTSAGRGCAFADESVLHGSGGTNAQSVTASQMNYAGTFTASTTTCSGIATIASTGGAAFSVTPVAAGTCSFTITGGNATAATLNVVVTTTSVGGS